MLCVHRCAYRCRHAVDDKENSSPDHELCGAGQVVVELTTVYKQQSKLKLLKRKRYAILRDILPNILIHQNIPFPAHPAPERRLKLTTNITAPLFKFVFRHIS